jgi:hypothetical protein
VNFHQITQCHIQDDSTLNIHVILHTPRKGFRFCDQNSIRINHFPHTWYLSYPFHSPSCDHPNNYPVAPIWSYNFYSMETSQILTRSSQNFLLELDRRRQCCFCCLFNDPLSHAWMLTVSSWKGPGASSFCTATSLGRGRRGIHAKPQSE